MRSTNWTTNGKRIDSESNTSQKSEKIVPFKAQWRVQITWFPKQNMKRNQGNLHDEQGY